MRSSLGFSFIVAASFAAMILASCSTTQAVDGQATGWEALVDLRADVGGNTLDFVTLINLSTLIGEADYAQCMQHAGLEDYTVAPSWPAPSPDIEEHLVDWSSPEQELALTMLGPIDNLDRYGLGQAYQSFATGAGTLWTREWVLESDRQNASLFDSGVALEFDNICHLVRPASEGWIYTEAMDDLTHEFFQLTDELTYELGLTDCGPQWMYGDRDGDPFNYYDAGDQFPTSTRSAGTAWAAEFGKEVATAEENRECRANKLASGDDRITEAVEKFRDRNGDLIERAGADWQETEKILHDLINDRIAIDHPRILHRRDWSPDWAMVHGEDFVTSE